MPSRNWTFLALVAFLAFLTACSDDPVGPDISDREVGVVLSSIDLALTLFDVEDPSSVRTVGLGADGSPVSLAVRGRYAAVPMGIVPAVAVVDVRDGALLRTVALPEGSGATGAAFVNDSIVLVANPDRGSVSPVNVLRGTAGAEIEVGRYPQAVVLQGARVYVVNAELENFAPDGPSNLTVLDGASVAPVETIPLSGENAAGGAVGADGRLYVLQSGSWGAGNGALSAVNLGTGTEVDFFTGFGDFPGSIAVGEDGRVYVGSFGFGMLVWDAMTEDFVRGPDDPVAPGGVASTSGIGIDGSGRIYALEPDCQDPSVIHRLDAALVSELEIPVGVCPAAVAFTHVADPL